MKKQKKILIFCAKFNPPINFHALLIKKAIKKIKPDKIFILVDRNKMNIDHKIFPPFSYHKQMIKNLLVENKIKIDLLDFFENFNKKKIMKYKNEKIYFFISVKKYKQLKKNKTKKFNNVKNNLIENNCTFGNTKIFSNFNKKMFGKMNVDYIKKKHLYLEYMIKNKLSKSRYLHTLRVLNTATKIGYGNNFNDKQILQLQIAAILHDIGKMYDDKQIKKILPK